MTTSGSFDYSVTGNDITRRALRIVGVIPEGDEPTAEQLLSGRAALNGLVKSWLDIGVKLWAALWAVKVLAASSTVTVSAVKYRCIKAHTSSAAGVAGDEPGVGANWPLYWVVDSTISGTPSAWVTATGYTSIGEFTPATGTYTIERAFVRTLANVDTPLCLTSRAAFSMPENRTKLGTPEILWLDRQLTTPKCYLWPIPDAATYQIHYLYTRILEDFDAAANTPDFPQSWYDALVYGLAANLSDEYQTPLNERQVLMAKAKEMLALAQTSNERTLGTSRRLDRGMGGQ